MELVDTIQLMTSADYKYRYVMERTSETITGDYNDVRHVFNHICQTDVYQKAWNGEIDFLFRWLSRNNEAAVKKISV